MNKFTMYKRFDKVTLDRWKKNGVEFVETTLLLNSDKISANVLLTPTNAPMTLTSYSINSIELSEFSEETAMVNYLFSESQLT